MQEGTFPLRENRSRIVLSIVPRLEMFYTRSLACPVGKHSMPLGRKDTMQPSSNAMTVLQRRYLKKNSAGKPIESPAQMFRRVAKNIAGAERIFKARRSQNRENRPNLSQSKLAKDFFILMSQGDFLPNSPTLMNAGRDLQQLSACFVLPVEDSLEHIFSQVGHQALIHQSGGGTGFTFSHLRPKNDRVASTNGVASGPVSFMKIFNTATEVIKQGGTRRGANMGILRVDHPDILEFILLKQDLREMTNFNISVGLTKRFMKALQQGTSYPLINPRTRRAFKQVSAQKVFDQIVDAAWATGEPGVLFLDTMNRHNPTPHLGPFEATNPCGEQPLLPYESCILGSINVARFLSGPRHTRTIDYDRLAQIIPLAVRFLDNVIEVNHYPLPDIKTMTKGNRKIGLGIMGFADLLISLGIPYDSPEALTVGDTLMGFIKDQAHESSLALGKERGVFPQFKGSRHAKNRHRLRNATVTTIAPTGTISIIADCSPGIEPLYAVSFARTVMEDVRLDSMHPVFLEKAREAGILSENLLREVSAQESIQHLSHIPENIRRLFVTAHDVSSEQHVRIQAAFQRHSDSGVSKTINLPVHATRKDVGLAFLQAYTLGCKGITVYRTGSRGNQVFSCTNTQYCVN